ncbi:MAG: UbiA family prenyltransferase [Halobacteriota archaeon]|uniref:UbiA family prenyltransferase n=1 Tax=Natronomonas sp. TaxID=2184060 RepID=UPI0039750AF0
MAGPTADERPTTALLVAALAFLVHSNLFISTAATGVALSTILLVGLPPDPVALFIVFAATLFVYSLNRITDLDEDRTNVPNRADFTERYGRILFAVGMMLYLAAIGGALALGLPGAPFLVLPAVAAALYSLFRVKQLLLVKNLIVGVSWGIIPLGVAVYYGTGLTPEIVFLSAFFTVMLTVAAAVFDIKDIEGDREEGIRTVPIVFGLRKTRLGALAVTGLVAVFVVGLVALGVVPRRFLVLLAFLAYVAAYVPFATEDRGPLFYGFVIDGEHVFLALLVVAMQFF